MADWDDVNILGIWLGLDFDDIERFRSENNSVRGAALKILGSFYTRSAKSDPEKWGIIIAALKELKREAIIQKLGLNELASENASEGENMGYGLFGLLVSSFVTISYCKLDQNLPYTCIHFEVVLITIYFTIILLGHEGEDGFGGNTYNQISFTSCT